MRRYFRKRASSGKRWSEREDRIILTLYPDYAGMQRRLRLRSYYAIRNRARTLGVVTRRHVWTNSEVTKLRALYLHICAVRRVRRLLRHSPGSGRIRSPARLGIFASSVDQENLMRLAFLRSIPFVSRRQSADGLGEGSTNLQKRAAIFSRRRDVWTGVTLQRQPRFLAEQSILIGYPMLYRCAPNRIGKGQEQPENAGCG
jgi:hypothetical protein